MPVLLAGARRARDVHVHPRSAAYELLKRRAVQLCPDSIEGYLFLKDPVLHIIYEAASLWAEKVRWTPDEDYV